jgi:Ca2+-binding RTX toxin-like protein
VSSAGDVNGDGIGDLMVGAHGADGGGSESGATYVVFGKTASFASAMNLSTLDGTNGFRLDGVAATDHSGRAVAVAGDVNSDGFSDLLVGAPEADNGVTGTGSTYVVFGKAPGFASALNLSTLDGIAGFRLDGVAMNDVSGLSIAAAGDVNGDGFADVLLGASSADNGVGTSGSSYVIFGRAPDAAVSRIGSAAGQYISGGAFADSLAGGDGNDVLEGRAGGDSLKGGGGSNTASYVHAAAGVKASLAAPGNNTGVAKNDTYSNIQNLEGSGFADNLTGNGKANRLTGGKAKDTLTGKGEDDVFVFRTASESLPGSANSDAITDFDPGGASSAADKIDLSAIDAKAAAAGNQAFIFRGTKAFNGAGQVRIKKSGSDVIVQGNTVGVAGAEFEIVLKGLASTIGKITAKDFKL